MLRNLGFSSADIGISSKTLNPIEMFYVYITCIILDFKFSDQEKNVNQVEHKTRNQYHY